MKFINTPGYFINWDDLRGWPYYLSGNKFNNNFNYYFALGSYEGNFSVRICVYICSNRSTF